MRANCEYECEYECVLHSLKRHQRTPFAAEPIAKTAAVPKHVQDDDLLLEGQGCGGELLGDLLGEGTGGKVGNHPIPLGNHPISIHDQCLRFRWRRFFVPSGRATWLH